MSEIKLQINRIIAYNDAFREGKSGVDAMTFAPKAEAVTQPTNKVIDQQPPRQDYGFSQIKSSEALASAFGLKYGVKGEIPDTPVTVELGLNVAKSFKSSKLSFTWLYKHTIIWPGFSSYDKPSLTPSAQKLIASDPTKFRDVYGDYYVTGSNKIAIFLAATTFTATNEKDILDLGLKVEAEMSSKFTAESRTTIFTTGSTGSVKVSEVEGVSEVVAALEKHLETATGSPFQARLDHYSTLDDTFPIELPGYTETLYGEVRALLVQINSLEIMVQATPNFPGRARLSAEASSIKDTVLNALHATVSNPEKRQAIKTRVDTLIQACDAFAARSDFITQVNFDKNSQPPHDTWFESNSTNFFTYGRTTITKDAVAVLQLHQTEFSKVYESTLFTFKFDGTMKIDVDARNIIVGWQVENVWGDGTNGRWKIVGGGIFTTKMEIFCEAAFKRGCHYRLKVWTVVREEFNFELIRGL